jgi:hypothetical protein
MGKSSVKPASAIQALSTTSLRVEFYQQADRIAHRVLHLEDPRSWRPILESVEGDAESLCPPSPAFQQIHRARIESDENCGEAIMLIGGAGTNHWSACVSCDSPGEETFTFDVACRCLGPAVWLGSTYRLPPSDQANHHADRALIPTESGRIELAVMQLGANESAELCTLRLNPGTIEIARSVPVMGDATTCRWRYSITLLCR